MDDHLIQQRFQAGDETILAEIERRHRDLVVKALGLAYSLKRREASALFSLALEEMWERRRAYDPEAASIGVFLFRVASRLAIARLRDEPLPLDRPGSSGEEVKPALPSTALPPAQRQAILSAYDHLRHPYKDILRLDLAAEGTASSRFVARVTGVPESKVPAHRRRALERLEKTARGAGAPASGAGKRASRSAPILGVLLEALRRRGDLLPGETPALEQWLEKVEADLRETARAPVASARVPAGKQKDGGPCPAGWLDDLTIKADFERSFAELEGRTHFHTEALRGHIRSLQLRFAEAWLHLDRAQTLVDEADQNIPNLIREFLLHIWCFENALGEAPLVETNIQPPALWIPDLPPEVFAEYPEVKFVLDHRRRVEAMLRLHLGHWDDAKDLYRELIDENAKSSDGSLAHFYAGLAACEHNLGMEEEAVRSLENAGLACLAGGKTLDRAMHASILCALHGHIEQDGEAESWRTYIRALPCPEATREIFLRRADLIAERCAHHRGLLIF